MEDTAHDHRFDEKDARTTGEFSASSLPGSEKDYLDEPAGFHRFAHNNDVDDLRTMSDQPHQPVARPTQTRGSMAGAAADEERAENQDEIGPAPLPSWRFGLLGLGICLGLFLAMLDTSIVATCLYSIAVEFKTLESINWVALAYTLTYLGCSVMFARVSDVVGRRAAFLSAFVVFIAFSIACGFAQNMTQLIAFRALQGLGGSGLYSIAIIILPELTPDSKKKFIAAIVGVVIAVAGVLGPVIGGLLTHYRSWRYVFYINGPIGGVSIIVFWLTWPKKEYLPDLERRRWKDIDYLGSLLLVAASVLVVFSFQNASVEADQWNRAIFIAPLVFGVCSLLALFLWEYFIERRWKGAKAAALPLPLLRNRVYTACVLTTMLTGFPYFLSIYAFPIRFQVVNGKSPLEAGLMLLPMLGATAMGSSLSGAISGKKNRIFETLLVACAFMLIGCALETTMSDSQDIEPKVLGFLVFIGLGFGLSASSSTMLASIESPVWEHAPAQGIVAQSRILGGSLGIAASSAILGTHTRTQLAGMLSPEQLTDLGPAAETLTAEQSQAVRRTYTDSLRMDMIVCTAVLAAGLLCALGVYRRNRPTVGEQVEEHRRNERERRKSSRATELAIPATLQAHQA